MMFPMNRKIKILFALGVLLVLLPFTGFPDSWKTFFDVLFGLGLVWIAYMLHKEAPLSVKPVAYAQSPRPYAENQVSSQ